MSWQATQRRNTLPKEDLALIHIFAEYLYKKRPEGFTKAKGQQSYNSWNRGGYAWSYYQLGGTRIPRLIYWYQHENDKPNKEWRPSIIMRAVLEQARLAAEIGEI